MNRRTRFWISLAALAAMLLLSVGVGRYALNPAELLGILTGNPPSEIARDLFLQIRLPRVLAVALSGGLLALSGLVFQTIFANPLVSPDVLGATNGCAVGAVWAMLFLPAVPLLYQGCAFVCGVASAAAALWLARRVGRNPMLGLILSGMVVGSLASALLMILKYCADPTHQLPAIEYWLMGGFQNAMWPHVWSAALCGLPAAAALYLLRFRLKVLSLGDDRAAGLGLSPAAVRRWAVVLATLPVAGVISIAGMVSWVALIVPHLVRVWGERDVTRCMGTVFCCGSALLLAADLLARTLTAAEIPVSIFTSLFGAAALAALLLRGALDRGEAGL